MAEEWLEKLASQIKDKERKGAEDAARSRYRSQLIGQRGPLFWKSFSDALQEHVASLGNLLEGDVTLAEGPLSFAFDTTTLEISFAKAAFPTVYFKAIPKFDRGLAEITYLSAGHRSEAVPMSCQLEISTEGRVTMRLDGRTFTHPGAAATFVMERLFHISSAQRSLSQDSHLGRVGSE
jgi:hypothetical protein